jgi:hypothetical protein
MVISKTADNWVGRPGKLNMLSIIDGECGLVKRRWTTYELDEWSHDRCSETQQRGIHCVTVLSKCIKVDSRLIYNVIRNIN